MSIPIADPAVMGAKTTPTVQLAPAAKLAAQLFCIRANPGVTERVNWPAGTALLLLTVTVCTALDDATTVAENINCAGATLSPFGASPAPLSGTVTGVTPAVAEEMISAAEFSPAVAGVKIVCTVQLLAALSVAAHVEPLTEKLLALVPAIWNPTLTAASPPVLLIVNTFVALAEPTA